MKALDELLSIQKQMEEIAQKLSLTEAEKERNILVLEEKDKLIRKFDKRIEELTIQMEVIEKKLL